MAKELTKLYESETLKMITKHLTKEAIEDMGHGGIIDFPFFIDVFAKEMDERLLHLKEVMESDFKYRQTLVAEIKELKEEAEALADALTWAEDNITWLGSPAELALKRWDKFKEGKK